MQFGFDFAQFYTEATQLHLEVDATEKLNDAISAEAGEVAGAVHARGRFPIHCFAEWVRYETLGGQFIAIHVTTSHLHAADQQFARHAYRCGLILAIDNVDLSVGNRTTDGHGGLSRIFLAGPVSNIDGGFGRAVQVVQFCIQLPIKTILQVGRQGFTTANYPTQ